jgi:hypothetical protein
VLKSAEKGAIAELEVAAAAVKLGVTVYKPVREQSRADLLFEIGPQLFRVQCKWGRLSATRDVIIVRSGGSWLSPRGYVRNTYSEKEIDLFAVYCGGLDRCYLIPASVGAGKHELWLRLSPSRNSQRACINLAEDYEFAGAVAQLARASGWQPEGQGFESPQLHTLGDEPTTVGSNPFRDHLGYWLERASRGEEVIVTFRGKPRVRVGPVAAHLPGPQPPLPSP